jgi:crossover junction endodeoxyribonuclease RuvC
MTVVLGVDPGATGAIAVICSHEGLLAVEDMPHHDGIVSGVLITELLDDWWCAHRPSAVWIESVHSMPRQGVASSFKFGRAFGTVEGALGAARIPINYVAPNKWKADAGLSKDKTASRRRATELWPTHASTFARVKDDGRAEAALIARYGLAHHL